MLQDGFYPDAFEIKVQHAERLRQQEQYRAYLSSLLSEGEDTTLLSDLQDLLPHHYKKWGEAGALVVDIALREVPPVELSLTRRILTLGRAANDFTWPDNMFAVATPSPIEEVQQEQIEAASKEEESTEKFDDETLELEATINDMDKEERMAMAARVFAEARDTTIRSSRWPGKKNKAVKFDQIMQVPTNYRHLLHHAEPFRSITPELREAYEEGFSEKAEELGFPGIAARHGFEILRRAPKKLQAIKIRENSEKTRAHVLTEHGALLTLHKNKKSNWLLPASMESIWERTRAQSPTSPDAVALYALQRVVVQRVQELLIAQTPILAPADRPAKSK